jgi:hypothetical protein
LGLGVGELLLEWAEWFFLLGDPGEGIVEVHWKAAVGGFQLGNTLLRAGALQRNDLAAAGAQVQAHRLGYLGQRFLSHHADRQHGAILSAQPKSGYGSARDRIRRGGVT